MAYAGCLVGLLLVVGGLLAVGAIVLLYYLISGSSSQSQSLRGIIARYPCNVTPRGPILKDETIQIGSGRWRHCAHISAEEQGLYVAVRPPLVSFDPMLIPWERVTRVVGTRLYYQKAYRLDLDGGDCEMIVMGHILDLVEHHVAEGTLVDRDDAEARS